MFGRCVAPTCVRSKQRPAVEGVRGHVMNTNFALTRSRSRGLVVAAFASLPLAIACFTAVSAQPVERPQAFAVYLDPLPLPVVPFCPDCLKVPGPTSIPKVAPPRVAVTAPRVAAPAPGCSECRRPE